MATKKKAASRLRQPKKRTGRKAKSSNDMTTAPIPPRKRAIVLKRLRKMASKPSTPSDHLGPLLDLSFDAPIKRSKRKTETPRKASRKRRRS